MSETFRSFSNYGSYITTMKEHDCGSKQIHCADRFDPELQKSVMGHVCAGCGTEWLLPLTQLKGDVTTEPFQPYFKTGEGRRWIENMLNGSLPDPGI